METKPKCQDKDQDQKTNRPNKTKTS